MTKIRATLANVILAELAVFIAIMLGRLSASGLGKEPLVENPPEDDPETRRAEARERAQREAIGAILGYDMEAARKAVRRDAAEDE